jgi:hypothetical protein
VTREKSRGTRRDLEDPAALIEDGETLYECARHKGIIPNPAGADLSASPCSTIVIDNAPYLRFVPRLTDIGVTGAAPPTHFRR